jgi:bifunctional DNA-binding transcriptional regulator/antitoxin component of YhaV-PrlF toxin-antitoxin module
MNATLFREKRQITLPQDVSEAADLRLGDKVEWRFDQGEIRGRKMVPSSRHYRPGKVLKDGQTGLLYFDSDISAAEVEEAALSANVDRL